ncbi:hypothetical protein DRP05_00860 [Archaeoglobales archaeon]|nr:MAG: hypothetical protein DRP05_00860 [Archaeoglobales archaeon]
MAKTDNELTIQHGRFVKTYTLGPKEERSILLGHGKKEIRVWDLSKMQVVLDRGVVCKVSSPNDVIYVLVDPELKSDEFKVTKSGLLKLGCRMINIKEFSDLSSQELYKLLEEMKNEAPEFGNRLIKYCKIVEEKEERTGYITILPKWLFILISFVEFYNVHTEIKNPKGKIREYSAALQEGITKERKGLLPVKLIGCAYEAQIASRLAPEFAIVASEANKAPDFTIEGIGTEVKSIISKKLDIRYDIKKISAHLRKAFKQNARMVITELGSSHLSSVLSMIPEEYDKIIKKEFELCKVISTCLEVAKSRKVLIWSPHTPYFPKLIGIPMSAEMLKEDIRPFLQSIKIIY